MITVKELTEADPRDLAGSLTVTISCLVRTARYAALHADATSDPHVAGAVETTLQVAGELLNALDEAIDLLERDTKRGMWKEKPSQTSGGCDGGSKNPEAGIS